MPHAKLTEFFTTVFNGDTAAVLRLIREEGVPIDAKDEAGEIVRTLITTDSNKALLASNPTVAQGWSALHLATRQGHTEMITALLGEGADPNPINDYGRIPLHIAAQRGDPDIFTLLLSARTLPPDIADREGLTPMHFAAIAGHASIVTTLLAAGANPHRADGSGRSAMRFAQANGHTDVEAILAAAPTPDMPDLWQPMTHVGGVVMTKVGFKPVAAYTPGL